MRTVVIRVARERGSSNYTVRGEVIDGQAVLSRRSFALRVPEYEPVTIADDLLVDLVDAVRERVLLWHSEGVQLQLPW